MRQVWVRSPVESNRKLQKTALRTFAVLAIQHQKVKFQQLKEHLKKLLISILSLKEKQLILLPFLQVLGEYILFNESIFAKVMILCFFKTGQAVDQLQNYSIILKSR